MSKIYSILIDIVKLIFFAMISALLIACAAPLGILCIFSNGIMGVVYHVQRFLKA